MGEREPTAREEVLAESIAETLTQARHQLRVRTGKPVFYDNATAIGSHVTFEYSGRKFRIIIIDESEV